MTVVSLVLAAGKGTRMRSGIPKVFHAVAGRTMLRRAVDAVRPISDRVLVVGGPETDLWERALEGTGCEVVVQEERRGTADAVLQARGALEGVDGVLLVTCGDVPLIQTSTLEELLRVRAISDSGVAVLTVALEDPTGYGRIVRDEQDGLAAIVEEADAADEQRSIPEINSGLYAFRIPLLWEVLDRIGQDNAQGELYLTDAVRILKEDGRGAVAVPAEDASEVLGVNTREELAQAGLLAWDRNLLRLMQSGVTVLDPNSTFIGDDVRGAPDAVLSPGVILEGSTELAGNTRVGPWSRLRDCRLEEGSRVLDHCVLENTRLGTGAVVGPFARMRDGVVLGPDVQIGNFVEVKGSTIGEGTKAKHLAYLGNATIGRGANVGAGTITCNHDGYRKHPTTLEDGAYVGSNATLVAPVTIGEGAYVGAGSVITEDVPADALALGRSRQTLKKGWAAKRRKKEKSGG